MAARENQGLLIAVIILVLLTLVLALTSFLGLSKAGENADSNQQLEEKVKYLEKLADGYQSQAEVLKALAGDFGLGVAEAPGLLERINGLPSGFEEYRRRYKDDSRRVSKGYLRHGSRGR